jgi:hypothetical protein
MSKSARNAVPASADTSAEARVAAYDWKALAGELDSYGCAVLPNLLTPDECHATATLYPDESHFRSHIIMARPITSCRRSRPPVSRSIPAASSRR